MSLAEQKQTDNLGVECVNKNNTGNFFGGDHEREFRLCQTAFLVEIYR